jgi:hypothetical protein
MIAVTRVLLVVVLMSGCASTQPSATADGGSYRLGRWVVRSTGPELDVALGFMQASRDLGEEWLILALELTSAPAGGVVTIDRADITAVTPDGRRLALADQNEFRQAYGSLRVRLERAMAILPVLGRYDTSRMPCDRWFLADPFAGFAYDTVSVNTFQVCSGPLVFRVAGGVQPGRWRLLIDLPESRVDLPFELEPQ